MKQIVLEVTLYKDKFQYISTENSSKELISGYCKVFANIESEAHGLVKELIEASIDTGNVITDYNHVEFVYLFKDPRTLFKAYPFISAQYVGARLGIKSGLMNQYTSGNKKCGKERLRMFVRECGKLAAQMLKARAY